MADVGAGDFEFAVAISLLGEDEPFARELHEEITKVVRGDVFLYSRKKEDLAISGDLVERFTEVFRDEARLVVIVYRPGWGGTPFTSIEHDAIKARRGRVTDLRWVVVVSMEPPTLPDWYPGTEFWLSPETFSVEAMAAVIAARASEAGAKVGRETPVELARRLSDQERRREERDRRMQAEAGQQAMKEIGKLIDHLKEQASGVTEAWQPMEVKEGQRGNLSCIVTFQGQELRVFCRKSGSTLQNAELVVQRHHRRRGRLERVSHVYQLELDGQDVWCWRNVDMDHGAAGPVFVLSVPSEDLKTTTELADDLVRVLVEGAAAS